MAPEIANGIISLFAPVLVSFLKDAAWRDWQKRLLALAVSLAIGALVVLVSRETGGGEWAEHLFIAVATTQAAYALFWEKTSLEAVMRSSGAGGRTSGTGDDSGPGGPGT